MGDAEQAASVEGAAKPKGSDTGKGAGNSSPQPGASSCESAPVSGEGSARPESDPADIGADTAQQTKDELKAKKKAQAE